MIDSFVPAAVLDTNVVLDLLVFHDRGVAPLALALQSGGLHWLATRGMRDEFAYMLEHASLSRWSPDTEQALTLFDRFSTSCAAAPTAQLRCRDPSDQAFIDLALAQRATWLVTHDRALLQLAPRARQGGVAVVRPAAWCAAWRLLYAPPS